MKSSTLTIGRSDLAVLVLHMQTMRQNIKRGLKANYGAFEGKQKVKTYDDTKRLLAESFEDETEKAITLLEDQLDILNSFLEWYVPELILEAEDEGLNLSDNHSLNALERCKKEVALLFYQGEIEKAGYHEHK
jgi:hypothetical protein